MKSLVLRSGNLFHLALLYSAALLAACNNSSDDKKSPDNNNKNIQANKTEIIPKPVTDTIVIDKEAAVFFTADTAHAESFKTKFGESAYDGTDHECFYQMKNSRTSIKEHWPQVHIYEVKSNVILQFIKYDDQKIFIDLSQKNDLCGLYIFNRKKDPQPADMMGIGTSLETYFLK